MKATDVKRLQRNAAIRERYAALSQVQKDFIRQKRKAAYAKKKESLPTGRKTSVPKAASAELRGRTKKKNYTIDNGPELLQKKETTLQSRRNKCADETSQIIRARDEYCRQPQLQHPNKGIIIKDSHGGNPTACNRENMLLNALDKGKEQISFYSTFEIGCTSSATEEPFPIKEFPLLQEDFPISRLRQVKHIISSTTYCQSYDIVEQTPPTYAHVPRQKTTPSKSQKRARPKKGSGRDHLKNIFTKASILPPVSPCKYCSAKRFYHEPDGFCCSNGEIALVSNTVPDELYDLYTCKSEDAAEFRTYVRTYNNTFAFTSFGVRYDKQLCKRNKGIYTFKIQGQVYHYLNEVTPTNNDPSYLQLYFYDPQQESGHRLNNSNKLRLSIVEKLIRILKINPYATFFRNIRNTPDWTEQQIIIRADPNLDQRVFNSPSSSEVAAIWHENTESVDRRSRDIILFPYGEIGWHQGIERANKRGKKLCDGQFLVSPCAMKSPDEIIRKEDKVLTGGKKNRHGVSCREYYCYKLQIRPNEKSVLLRSGRLLQQYAIDMYVKLETSRLDYFRRNQIEIRAEAYQGVVDSVASGETRASKVGKPIILPSSFIGGPRDMRRRYMDAMALVQKFGKPDLFLTMTCNPNWQEIKSELHTGEEIQNRPDLSVRIFKAKLEVLKDDLINKEILGPIAAYTYVIEFQKRGLPHAHFSLTFHKNAKLLTPDAYDRIVSAELPEEEEHPHLYKMVVKHMMHGPCGDMNPDNICMKRDHKCKNHYPKKFNSTTTQGNDSYPIYRRRDDGKKVKVRKHILDNQWVVPHNPYLLAKYDCHINVEICSTIKLIKYLYKYVFKGHDQIAFNIAAGDDSNDVDEIQRFQSARWIAAQEAMWRIYRFPLNEMRPAVQSLHLHLEVGTHQGENVFIPRIPLQPSDNEKYPIPFERKQFPVRLCFAMTINKAQGQTLENVGLYLPQPVFSHGQLYVALSRARTSKAVKIMIKPMEDDSSDYNSTRNVVFEEVLTLAET